MADDMTRSRVYLVLAVLAVAGGLTLLALRQADPETFANKWYWSNDGVGNYFADITAVGLGLPKLVKEWRAHKAQQAKIHEHQLKILDKLDVLHRHHGIGDYAGKG